MKEPCVFELGIAETINMEYPRIFQVVWLAKQFGSNLTRSISCLGVSVIVSDGGLPVGV